MKKHLLVLPLAMVAILLIASPQGASAHETHIYRIGNQAYQFTVGSLNEPITVDDSTGVDLRVIKAPIPGAETPGHEATAGAVEGLDQTLKVEISAGDKKKTLDLRPKFGQPGSYSAKFYPTIQTTYTYRFFGTLNNVPIDLGFSCNPAGHPQVDEDKTEVKVSDRITRLLKRGAFGCPTAKSDLGFPEQSASLNDLQNKVNGIVGRVSGIDARVSDLAPTTRNFTILAIVIGLLGLIAGVGAWMKGRKV